MRHPVNRLDLASALVVLALGGAYGLAMASVGYLASTIVALAAFLVMSGTRNRIVVAVVSVGLPVGLYFFFQNLMSVPLPRALTI